jgi:hypothetical protein
VEPVERTARALCKYQGYGENTRFEGKPMWRSFMDEASIAFNAVGASDLVQVLCELADDNRLPDAARRRARKVVAEFKDR